ncbi:hypothetical protein [Streptomyces sp. NPDC051561]|uniref:hypothetical protein n=1 Tax=Streptomyces sp. NPDC051561 TaxID=3365658 RepID=UPI0037B2C020
MTDEAGTGACHWEMFDSEHVPQRDVSSGVFVTLLHLLTVGGAWVGEPLAGIALGTVFAVFWGAVLLPPYWRDRRSVVAVDIRPGPPATLVLRRYGGAETTRPLASLTRLRTLTVGYRSADSKPDEILELRVGRSVYRTRAAFNTPENDVQLLADALRLACPQVVIAPHVNRSTWASDGG